MPEAALAPLPINADAEPGDNLPQTLASLMLSGPSLIIVTVPNSHAAARVLSPLQAKLKQTELVLTLDKPEDTLDFFRQLARQLNIDYIGVSLASLSASVMAHILNLHSGCVMLLCSDADAYDTALLEQIRQWDNLQLQHGHVSILLCGGEGLMKKLRSPALRGLHQRIVAHYRLTPVPVARIYWLSGAAAVGSLALLWAASSLYRAPQQSTEPLGVPTTPRVLKGAAPAKSQTKKYFSPSAASSLPRPDAHSLPKTSPPLDHIFNSEAEALAALSQNAEHRTLQRQ